MRLSIFPLPGAVLFPGLQLPLHIFEPRYRQLFEELDRGEVGSFVIVPYLDGRLRAIGTELELVEVSQRYESGELDVQARGLGPVRILGYDDPLGDKLYAGGPVERLTYDYEATDYSRAELLVERLRELTRSLGTHVELPEPGVEGLSYAVGHRVGLSPKREFRLLTIEDEDTRQDFLLRQCEKAIQKVRETVEMRRRIQMNGHFRYLRGSR